MKKRRLSPAEKQYLAAEKELNDEKIKQLSIIYSAAAVVFWEKFGWRKQRIMNRFRTSMFAFEECGDYGPSKSMLQMFEEETGIEMTLDGYDYSYHQFSYLDGDRWNGKTELPITVVALMRKKQKQWLPPTFLAGLCLALHRDEGWGMERLSRFIAGVDEQRKELGSDVIKPHADRMEAVTGISLERLWNDREIWGE